MQHTPEIPSLGLLQTLMLSSTALPIGAYCYSQGIETAIDLGIICNEATALTYMQELLQLSLVRFDLPLLVVLLHTYGLEDKSQYLAYAAMYRASRESKEMLAEVQQIAYSFQDWIRDVGAASQLTQHIDNLHDYGFLPVYAALNHVLQQRLELALTAYTFSQLENLVLAIVKTVPLGQMMGQRILWKLSPQIDTVVAKLIRVWQCSKLDTDAFLAQVAFSSSLPHLAFMSIRHENLYCRLFRS